MWQNWNRCRRRRSWRRWPSAPRESRREPPRTASSPKGRSCRFTVLVPEKGEIADADHQNPEGDVEKDGGVMREPAVAQREIVLRHRREVGERLHLPLRFKGDARLEQHLSQKEEHAYQIDREGKHFHGRAGAMQEIIEADHHREIDRDDLREQADLVLADRARKIKEIQFAHAASPSIAGRTLA